MMEMRAVTGLAGFLALSLGAELLAALLTKPGVESWYGGLQKPSWTPPNWVFGPVWTLLYVLMAVAAWLVWRRVGWAAARLPLGLFGLQLTLNVAWSGLFFFLRMPGIAFAEIVLLWAAILSTGIAFWQVVPLAGWLLLPYWVWVSYAAALNFALWRLNLGGAS